MVYFISLSVNPEYYTQNTDNEGSRARKLIYKEQHSSFVYFFFFILFVYHISLSIADFVILRAYPNRQTYSLTIFCLIHVTYKRSKDLLTIRKIPNDLWDEIKLIFPPEKLNKIIGHPLYQLGRYQTVFYTSQDWMSMEDVTKRIWFWSYMSQMISKIVGI